MIDELTTLVIRVIAIESNPPMTLRPLETMSFSIMYASRASTRRAHPTN
jgi:hypothetical protein